MAKIVVVAKCHDQAKWEAGFLTHADLFRNEYGVTKPISYGLGDDHHVVACFEVTDPAASMNALNAPATAQAMQSDGLIADTVKIFVLDKELNV
ncbi:MAG TPA: hypothetical protein VGF86_07470 [Candidatus Tumulicola sp.]|jgi:hypothetical protein